MALQRVGQSTHFFYEYDDILGTDGLTIISGLAASCEADLGRIDQYLPHQRGSAGDVFARFPVIVRVQTDKDLPGDPGDPSASKPGPGSGFASNSGNPTISTQSNIIRINPSKGGVVVFTVEWARFLFVAEMTEQNMCFYGWNPGDSQGEGISRWVAYKLYPNPEVDVNAWMNTNPRPDWVNNTFTGNSTTPGDQDGVSFGCSLIFLNYIESQLNLSMSDFLLAGGHNLADRYHNLTKQSDDPFQTMNNLLLAHFPAAATLTTNNPFPLYDAQNRKVFFSFPKPSVVQKGMGPGGIALVSPFFTCPAKDYGFSRLRTAETRSIVASTLGFGNPNYAWKVQAVRAFQGAGSGSVNVDVEVPEPNNPATPQETTAELDYTYQCVDSGDQIAKTSTLTLTNTSFDGDYIVEISVDVTEQQEGNVNPVTASQHIDLNGLLIQYVPQYYLDRAACQAAFEKAITHLPKLEKLISIVKTLPDPPSDRTLTKALEAVVSIRQLVAEVHQTNQAEALRIAEFAAVSLGVSRGIFLEPRQSPR
jgi:hypothetical protein